jgi:hypothetical protein
MARQNEIETTSLRGNLARGVLTALLLVVSLAAVPCFARPGQQQPGAHPHFGDNQQPHLGTWLQRHQSLSPEQQEQALQREPGFNRLPPETQQRLLTRLRQLNKMPPQQRQRTLDRIEAMEHLSPQMRQQVRASFQDFRSLPQDRQRMVRKAFRDLREYPPEQRTAMMNSPRFQAQFSPQERSILSNILAVEPYQAIQGPRHDDGLEYGR